jgi:hypothetical protein
MRGVCASRIFYWLARQEMPTLKNAKAAGRNRGFPRNWRKTDEGSVFTVLPSNRCKLLAKEAIKSVINFNILIL